MLAHAIAVALAFWGPPPCGLDIAVAELEPGLAGSAHVYSSGRCTVEVAAGEWRWWELCSVLTHEVGHVHGRVHSDDPFDVMFPVVWRPAENCRGERPAQFRRGEYVRLP